MTKQQAKRVISPFVSSPGFILNLSRNDLENLMYEHTGTDLGDFGSNEKRLMTWLETASDGHAETIIKQLNQLKENK